MHVMFWIGMALMCLGLIGMGRAKRMQAQRDDYDTALRLFIGAFVVIIGIIACWQTAGGWLMTGSGKLQFAICGIAFLASVYYLLTSIELSMTDRNKSS